jgi:S-adenosylmethionine hydrolase
VLHRHELPSESVNKDVICDACQQGKSHQLPFSLSTRVTTSPLEIIYLDAWGPVQTSINEQQFYMSFVDV